MRRRFSNLAVLPGVALVLASGAAHAQIDTNPPLPNVLLLIDNSGSMERMIDGSLPESSPANTCNCDPVSGVCNWSAQPAPGRFSLVQQALTGAFVNGYNCAAMPRSSGSVFANEYQIGGVAPYDINYYLPYHRPIAEDTSGGSPVACVYAPGALPGASTPNGVGPLGAGAGGLATDFPPTAIATRQYGSAGSPKACTFAQYQSGALDTARDLMRFGLMTFDQDPSAGIGVTTGASPQVVSPAFAGQWSYFPGWSSGSACTYTGNPAGCSTSTLMAVGARNPAAPPWEGRMVLFPKTYDLTAQETTNSQIQQVLMATRPYGATPVGGMFAGAQYYFWTDPTGPQQTDPYVQGGCRPEYIILLTDGAPNLDMRPSCAASGTPNGSCPFPLPETTAQTLYTATTSPQRVTTYVIGFAVSSFNDGGTTVYCSNLVSGGSLAAQCQANPVSPLYAPCCELQKIALYGGSNHAYFADTPGDLQKAIGAILASIAQNTTTRTTPAYSPVLTNVVSDPKNPQTNSSIYLASFSPTAGAPWSGDVQRQRYQCTYSGSGFTVPPPQIQTSAGDDFASNLNSGAGPARTFIAFQPAVIGSGPTVDATTTIRPYVASTVADGVGQYSATTYVGSAASVVSSITPAALGVSSTSCSYYANLGGALQYLTQTQCANMLLDFTFGQSFTGPAGFSFVSRSGNAFGDVFHATPMVVSAPGSLLQDPAYVGFRNTYASNKQVVYVATNDGLLHAFWADETKLENNEMWAMLPPAVMPNLVTAYPSSSKFLLDGSPVVKDVVWDRSLSNSSDSSVFHTMLVASYGPQQQGYYAIDVSNPNPSALPNAVVPTDPSPAGTMNLGPIFRWQLTKMPSTNWPLFANYAATPAVTTLFMDPGDGGGAREIGVAILPGGVNGAPTSSASSGPPCARAPKLSDSAPLGGFTARSSVRCWGAAQKNTDPVVGRSVSIVRLDTGEILRVFARKADYVAPYLNDTVLKAGRVTDTPLDSPMTGAPLVYPNDVGTDATKFFLGDADGTVWRFDVSSSDPTQWFGELYLDFYNTTVDKSATAWADGQSLEVPPVMSLDTAGEVVLDMASGSTETYDTNGSYYVYSVTEKVQGATPKLRANVNWYLGPSIFQPGERVSGPMTVFDGTLYFSTYAATQPGQPVCTGGMGRLWGRDFVTPNTPTDLSQGGLRELQPPPPNAPQTPPPPYVQPSDYDSTLLGRVIPGVSIKATPACASLGAAGSDSYVAGATHQAPQNFAAGSYSLFATVGTKGTGGASTSTIDMAVPTPASPTTIDSWAAVFE